MDSNVLFASSRLPQTVFSSDPAGRQSYASHYTARNSYPSYAGNYPAPTPQSMSYLYSHTTASPYTSSSAGDSPASNANNASSPQMPTSLPAANSPPPYSSEGYVSHHHQNLDNDVHADQSLYGSMHGSSELYDSLASSSNAYTSSSLPTHSGLAWGADDKRYVRTTHNYQHHQSMESFYTYSSMPMSPELSHSQQQQPLPQVAVKREQPMYTAALTSVGEYASPYLSAGVPINQRLASSYGPSSAIPIASVNSGSSAGSFYSDDSYAQSPHMGSNAASMSPQAPRYVHLADLNPHSPVPAEPEIVDSPPLSARSGNGMISGGIGSGAEQGGVGVSPGAYNGYVGQSAEEDLMYPISSPEVAYANVKGYGYESGESEHLESDGDVEYDLEDDQEDDGEDYDDGDDGEFVPGARTRKSGRKVGSSFNAGGVRRSTRSTRARALSAASYTSPPISPNMAAYPISASVPTSYSVQQRRRVSKHNPTTPVPVPNLTKKSRGRRVPTSPVMVLQGGVTKNVRTYTCTVKDCGKCFARGEHLKRHVRSIHTNEKPHKCPYPGCGKDFSRHDNLGQHMRVHKDYSAPKDGVRDGS